MARPNRSWSELVVRRVQSRFREQNLGSHDWGLRVLALLVFLGGIVAIAVKVKPVSKPAAEDAIA